MDVTNVTHDLTWQERRLPSEFSSGLRETFDLKASRYEVEVTML